MYGVEKREQMLDPEILFDIHPSIPLFLSRLMFGNLGYFHI